MDPLSVAGGSSPQAGDVALEGVPSSMSHLSLISKACRRVVVRAPPTSRQARPSSSRHHQLLAVVQHTPRMSHPALQKGPGATWLMQLRLQQCLQPLAQWLVERGTKATETSRPRAEQQPTKAGPVC
jgi:hypothetical protein